MYSIKFNLLLSMTVSVSGEQHANAVCDKMFLMLKVCSQSHSTSTSHGNSCIHVIAINARPITDMTKDKGLQ